MKINRINNSYKNTNSSAAQTFGLKIDSSAQKVFNSINDFFDKNMVNHISGNQNSTKFAKQMEEIRQLLPGCGIIHKKGGTGLCISTPNVFKEYKSKPDTVDTKLDFLYTPSQYSLIKLKSILQRIEREYTQAKKTYFDIHGKEFVLPEIFAEK